MFENCLAGLSCRAGCATAYVNEYVNKVKSIGLSHSHRPEVFPDSNYKCEQSLTRIITLYLRIFCRTIYPNVTAQNKFYLIGG